MIKVDVTSWHCRLLDFKDEVLDNGVGYDRPRTLCSYFWGVVVAPLKIIFVSCIVTFLWFLGYENKFGDGGIKHKAAFWTTLATITALLYLVIPYVFLYSIPADYLILLFLASFVVEVLSFIAVTKILYRIYDKRERPERVGDSFTTLTWKMVKSAKRKVCPLMEYKEA